MNKLFSYFFLSLGLLGIIYLIFNYRTEIPNKELWIVCNIFFIIIGGFLYVRQKIEAFRKTMLGDSGASNIDHLIKNGEKIRITLEDCEIKSSATHQQVSGELRETYISYSKQFNNQVYHFISGPTAAAPEDLRKYLHDNKGIDLYVDKENLHNYYFDLAS